MIANHWRTKFESQSENGLQPGSTSEPPARDGRREIRRSRSQFPERWPTRCGTSKLVPIARAHSGPSASFRSTAKVAERRRGPLLRAVVPTSCSARFQGVGSRGDRRRWSRSPWWIWSRRSGSGRPPVVGEFQQGDGFRLAFLLVVESIELLFHCGNRIVDPGGLRAVHRRHDGCDDGAENRNPDVGRGGGRDNDRPGIFCVQFVDLLAHRFDLVSQLFGSHAAGVIFLLILLLQRLDEREGKGPQVLENFVTSPEMLREAYFRATRTSVCPKSSPLNNNGSPETFARAYAKQSPKFNFAGWPLPRPKSR